MGCFKKRAMLIATGFLGIGGYILYQNLKTRIDDLEEEIWGIEDYELEDCPYCDRVYTMENEKYDEFSNNIEQTEVEGNYENLKSELHEEVQNYLEHVEEKNKNNQDDK